MTDRILLLVLISLLLPVVGCAGPPLARHDFTEIVMGVEARVSVYAPDPMTARTAARSAFARLRELEAVMSDYQRESELMRLCRAPAGHSVPVSRDLYRVLARGQALAAASGGAFDVTIGPLVGLWRAAQRDGRLPAVAVIAEARARCGWDKLVLEPRAGTATLGVSGMRLDLGGIGKGFGADEALADLRRHGVTRCLVDVGGDVALGDPPPGRRGWRVAIAPGAAGAPASTFELARGGVATSADTAQFLEVDGVRYSHIVDPSTGLGVTNRTAVTVIAPDAATADALASAVSVLGPESGLALVRRHPGASASIATLAGSAIARRVQSPTFPAGNGRMAD